MDTNTIITWVVAVLSGIATLIVVPLGFYIARYCWDAWRWHRFGVLIRIWAQEELFPDDMTDDDWHILASMNIERSGF